MMLELQIIRLHCFETIAKFIAADKLIIFYSLQKIAIELLVDSGGNLGSQCESHILQLASSSLPSSAPNIDHLKSGFEEYVSKHGNRLNDVCHCCFSTG